MMGYRELRQKNTDFENALQRLEEGLQASDKDSLAVDGVIQRFEFTFELAWKLMKVFMEEEGVMGVCLSPKTTVRQAFKRELIMDGQGWINMIQDRNRTSHMYNESMSRAIYKNIQLEYIQLFRELRQVMKQNLEY